MRSLQRDLGKVGRERIAEGEGYAIGDGHLLGVGDITVTHQLHAILTARELQFAGGNPSFLAVNAHLGPNGIGGCLQESEGGFQRNIEIGSTQSRNFKLSTCRVVL